MNGIEVTRAIRKKNNEQAAKLWKQAYSTGLITLDYTGEIDAEKITTKMHYFLRNFKTYHKKYPMKDTVLLEQMCCCRLCKVGDTMICIERIKLSLKSIGIYRLLTGDTVTNALDANTANEKVLNLFRSKVRNG